MFCGYLFLELPNVSGAIKNVFSPKLVNYSQEFREKVAKELESGLLEEVIMHERE